MLRLCKTTIIRLRISELRKEGIYIAIAIHSIVKLTSDISSLNNMLVEITFGKHSYITYYCKTLLRLNFPCCCFKILLHIVHMFPKCDFYILRKDKISPIKLYHQIHGYSFLTHF
jgi:hypothetical protein